MFIYLNTPIVDDLVRVKYSRSEKVSRLIEHLLASGQRRSRNCSMDKPASLRIPAKSDFLNGFSGVHGDDDAHSPLRMYEDKMTTLLTIF